jgi:2-polyprenyl-6-methoxyphenol hydroxylase-like FAD-dependent oxidoreductase
MDRMDCTAPFLTRAKSYSGQRHCRQVPHARITVDGVRTPHPCALMIPQYDTEELLGDLVTSLGVKIERNIELTDFVVSPDGVTSTLRHLNGREETRESGWLIGSDGAHSMVAQARTHQQYDPCIHRSRSCLRRSKPALAQWIRIFSGQQLHAC